MIKQPRLMAQREVIVSLNVDGTPTDFLVVHQGNPDPALYDSSCNGTWLLMKDCYENKEWRSTNSNKYASSTIHGYLNDTLLSLFDTNVQNAIKQVKIPYHTGGTNGTVNSGASGLSCKLFLLGGYEIGWTTDTSQNLPVDGAVLSYFKGTAATDPKRIAYLDSSAVIWWLRSPNLSGSLVAWCVSPEGGTAGMKPITSHGVRPALILDPDAVI